MTTKPPPPVAEFPPDSIEKLAYSVVDDIPTQEPNDRNRLGYSIWAWLKERNGTLEQAIRASGARTQIPTSEVISRVSSRLQERGVSVS